MAGFRVQPVSDPPELTDIGEMEVPDSSGVPTGVSDGIDAGISDAASVGPRVDGLASVG